MEALRQFLQGLKDGRREKAARLRKSRRDLLDKEISERVQIKEWNGKIYLSVDGVPMIDASLLQGGVIEALGKIRNEIINYKTN